MSDQTAPAAAAEVRSQPVRAVPVDASAATDVPGWVAEMEKIAEEEGYFDPLGDRHWAFFHDDGPTLLVTFEQLDDIRARPSQMPMGYDWAKARGWSHLCVIAQGETWYRDKRVYGYFDRLVDDAFFEDFDQVMFLGSGVQGYAAAAFAVAAPGAQVLLISPRASQSPDVAGWDRRNLKSRKLDFNSRYGYAPDMVEGVGRVFVLHDPGIAEDAMHAALFRGKHITHLRTPHLTGRVDWALGHMKLWAPLIDALSKGTLTRQSFAQMWRARRSFGPYLRGLLARNADRPSPKREKWICTSVVARLNAPNFRKRLNDILAAEAEAEATSALAAMPKATTAQPG